jgi:ATP-dependent Clp protease protease subunit
MDFNDCNENNNPQAVKEAYAVFSGMIDQLAVQRIFNTVALATQNGFNSIHLLFQSGGGFVADGVCLFNFFRSLPIDLTIYNAGSIQSIATIIYLGAKRRKVSTFGTFMIHRTHTTTQLSTADQLQAIAQNLTLDDQRTEAILRQYLTLADDRWTAHKVSDLCFNAEDAVRIGLAHEIDEFAPPHGQQIFNVSC